MLPVLVLFAVACAANAQTSGTKVPPDSTARSPFRILDQQELRIGKHSIIYNRVAPPVLPGPAAPAITQTATLSTVDLEKQREREKKTCLTAFLSATVYDRRLTELRWFGGGGQLRVLSNIDFNFLSGLGGFETEDSICNLIMGLGNETEASFANSDATKSSQFAAAKVQLPDLAANPQLASGYTIVEGNADENPEAMAALNAIHAYYNANRSTIMRDYRKRQADSAERARQLRLHPPVQKDTVINFWPKKNSIYLNSKE